MNRWILTQEVKDKYLPKVLEFLDEINTVYIDDTEAPLRSIDFSDTELNPYTLSKLLESLGYDKDETDSNGWEMDFWIYFSKDGFANVIVRGCGMTFELVLEKKEELEI